MFNIKKGDIVTITGGGGKTSLLHFLANTFSNKGSVVITTTTKIFLPKNEEFIFIYEKDLKNLKPIYNKPYVFIENIENNKITSISNRNLEILKNMFDFIFIEGDGSSHKSFKGWKENEPCIPNITSKIIAVIDLTLIDKEKNESTIHRFQEYQKQFKELEKYFSLDEIIHYIKNAPLFSNFNGEKYIFFNKIENLKTFKNLVKVGNYLFNSYKIYFGSILKKNIFKYRSITPIFLAAGFSKRFDSNKLLFNLKNGKTILENTILSIEDLKFTNAILIGRENLYKDISSKYNIKYIKNNESHLGQSRSVILGCLNSFTDGMLFIPSDMPFLTENTILKLIYFYQKYDTIIVPKVDSELYAPVIFPQKYKKNLLTLTGDKGGKSLLKTLPFTPCNFSNKKEFFDIDTKNDLIDMEDYI